MTLIKAIELLVVEYKKALQLEYIQKPLAYALFQVWKKADKQKRRPKMIDEITNEAAVACCPLCENEKCVGVGNCPEIKSYITTGPRKEMSIVEVIKQLDIIIGTEKVLIKHATMGEYQHSQQIEALEIAKKALEMQMPKKVIKEQNDVYDGYNYYCPNCKNDLDCYICLIIDADRESDVRYCGHCGQVLDWSDT